MTNENKPIAALTDEEIICALAEGRQFISARFGSEGPQGVQGMKGDKGDKGDKGEKGDIGPQGPQGLIGPKGPIGPQGERGLQGLQGIQGIQGPKGDKGDKGDQGIATHIEANGTGLNYPTVEDLYREHPIGEPGEAYLVGIDNYLYAWNEERNQWEAVGKLGALPNNVKEMIDDSKTEAINTSNAYTDNKVAALGKVFNYKGRVDTKADLPATGEDTDLWLVGLEADPDKAEYFWDGAEWEYLGNTSNQNYATIDAPGIIELATKEETLTGTDAAKAITPYTLKAGLDLKADNVDLVDHVSDKNNPHEVTKTQIGLSNVDNTSDADKPVSSATQQALNMKADLVDGIVPDSQLPAQVINAAKNDLSNVTSIASTSKVQTELDGKVSKAGDTMTGTLKMSGTNQVMFGTNDNNYFIQTNNAGHFNIYHSTGSGRGLHLRATENYAPYYKKSDDEFYRLLTMADKVVIAGWGMPSNRYINLTLGANGTTYTAPANGYFFISKNSTAASQSFYFHNQTSGMSTYTGSPNSSWEIDLSISAKKGDIVEIYNTLGGTTRYFRFIYAEGAK